jgi:hypothetical protein
MHAMCEAAQQSDQHLFRFRCVEHAPPHDIFAYKRTKLNGSRIHSGEKMYAAARLPTARNAFDFTI